MNLPETEIRDVFSIPKTFQFGGFDNTFTVEQERFHCPPFFVWVPSQNSVLTQVTIRQTERPPQISAFFRQETQPWQKNWTNQFSEQRRNVDQVNGLSFYILCLFFHWRSENRISSHRVPRNEKKKLEIDSSYVNLSPSNHNKTYRKTVFHWQTAQSNILYEV